MTEIYRSEDGKRAVEQRYRELLARWPVPAEHLRVPTAQGETFVIACGPSDAPPLVLLHGSATNSAMWLTDVAGFARHFRVYAIDLVGEPGLSAPSRPDLASGAYARWLEEVLDALDIRRISMVAVSLGGWIALDYATRHPGKVERLALQCPGGIGPQLWGKLMVALLLKPLGRWGRARSMRLLLGPASTSVTAPAPAAAPGTMAVPASSQAADFGAFMLLINGAFRHRMGRMPLFDDESLRRLTMPLLVIVGGRDAFLDSSGTRRRITETAPHAAIRFLPDWGHYLPNQTDEITGFLTENAHA
ncbi:alpha/beta fold hydrolase [Nonomuraea glycinis]|uniref:alpha/beta fold hydrolase n=1 Tax=Nonomuraea glycinis TaxID=2047744 RepID=UPI0033AEC0B9